MKNSFLKTLLSIFFIVIATIIFHFLGWLRPLENTLRSAIQPGSKLLYNLSIELKRDQKLPFDTAEDFLVSYKKLEAELQETKRKLIQFDLIREENFELRQQLHFFASTTYTSIGAEVIGKNIEPLANTLVLSRGEESGVKVGNPVVVSSGILIGKIVRVEKNTSLARLINDHQSKVAATVVNQDKSIGLVEGGYGISIRMNFIPQNETVIPGDTVVTSGLEPQSPRGLILGTVETVEKEAYEPFQKAILSPSVRLDKIFIVSILIPSENTTDSL